MDKKATAMRQQMDETMAGLAEKLGCLEDQVSTTVRTVTRSVNSVRDTLDLKLHVRQRPWTLVAGAAALGFLGGFHLHRPGPRDTARNGRSRSAPTIRAAEGIDPDAGPQAGTNGSDVAHPPAASTPSWLSSFGDKFQPEIAELRGILIGSLFGIARELISNQVLKPVNRQSGDVSSGSNGKFAGSCRTASPLSDTGDA